MINPGDVINLKNGHRATVTKVGLSDFVGGPKPVYVQYIADGKVVTDIIFTTELKEAKK